MALKASNVTNSVIIGEDNSGSIVNVYNTAGVAPPVDIRQLSQELIQLRTAMSQEAKTTEHYVQIGRVAEAEQLAQKNDYTGLLNKLKAVGEWTLDIATQISAGLAVEVIKRAMGL